MPTKDTYPKQGTTHLFSITNLQSLPWKQVIYGTKIVVEAKLEKRNRKKWQVFVDKLPYGRVL